MRWNILPFILLLNYEVLAKDPAVTPESISFKVKAEINYRCYDSSGKSRALDIRLKTACDGKDYKTTLVDKIVIVKVVREETPDGPSFAGDWDEKYEFKARKFEFGMTVFKEFSKEGESYYRLRAVASDDDENRGSSAILQAPTIKDFNPINIESYSIGEPEINVNLW